MTDDTLITSPRAKEEPVSRDIDHYAFALKCISFESLLANAAVCLQPPRAFVDFAYSCFTCPFDNVLISVFKRI